MVSTALLVGGAAVAVAAGLVKNPLKGRGGKFINFTTGVLRDFVIGAGAGGFLNWLDGKFGGGFLQNTVNSSRIGLGGTGKGQNLNGTDLIMMAGTSGLGIKKGTLKRAIPFLAGKKIGEFTGAIDPADPAAGQTILSANNGVRTG